MLFPRLEPGTRTPIATSLVRALIPDFRGRKAELDQMPETRGVLVQPPVFKIGETSLKPASGGFDSLAFPP